MFTLLNHTKPTLFQIKISTKQNQEIIKPALFKYTFGKFKLPMYSLLL